jgi:hypothetical protein
MTSAIIWLFVGVSALVLTTFYMVWTKFRVLIVRQELFDVRDELWQQAHRNECLRDPAYLDARERINSLIRTAHKISLPVLAYAMAYGSKNTESSPESQNDNMQAAIDKAVEKTAYIIMRYVFIYRPFSGLVPAIALMMFIKTLQSVTAVRDEISRWFRGGGPTRLEVASTCSR